MTAAHLLALLALAAWLGLLASTCWRGPVAEPDADGRIGREAWEEVRG